MNRMSNLVAASIGAALLAASNVVPAGAAQQVQSLQSAVVTAMPDLVIKTAKKVPSDNSKLRVRVKNIGSAGGGPNNMKLFYHRSGHVVVRGAVVPALGKGEAAWVVIDADSPIAHAEHVYLRVDDPNRVPELSEGNNSYVYK